MLKKSPFWFKLSLFLAISGKKTSVHMNTNIKGVIYE
tara:strand:- start:1000 stop:1110 length:111 start_codon:yes stop_codon:yes gene_type:complete